MKKDLKKLIALLLFGAAALSGCAIESRGIGGITIKGIIMTVTTTTTIIVIIIITATN